MNWNISNWNQLSIYKNICYIVTFLVLLINIIELIYNLFNILSELIHISMFIMGFKKYFKTGYDVSSNVWLYEIENVVWINIVIACVVVWIICGRYWFTLS